MNVEVFIELLILVLKVVSAGVALMSANLWS